MTDRKNNRLVKGGKAFTEFSAPLGKKEVQLGKKQRKRQIAKIDEDIEQFMARKEGLLDKIAEDDAILAAMDSGGDYGA
jgi:aminoglycoside phosphotransferase family enzyme